MNLIDALGRTFSKQISVQALRSKYRATNILNTVDQFRHTAMSIAPNGDVYLSGYKSNGNVWQIQKSTNGGAESSGHSVLAVTNDVILAAGSGDDGGNGNLIIRRSADRGLTWSTVYASTVGDDLSGKHLIRDSSGRVFVLASTYLATMVLRSDDNGLNWNVVYNSATETGMVLHLADDGVSLYLGVYLGDNSRIYRSTDAGGTWNLIDNYAAATRPTSVFSLFVRGNLICWVGRDGNVAFGAPNMHWFSRCSADAGVSWTGGERFRTGGNCWASSVAINAVGDIFVVGYTPSGQYLRKSTDAGVTWNYVAHPAGFTPSSLHADSSGNLYMFSPASTTSVGIQKSIDGGTTWNSFYQMPVEIPQYSSGQSVVERRVGETTELYSIGSLDSLWTVQKSTDLGANWTVSEQFNPGGGGVYAADLAVSSSGALIATGYQFVNPGFYSKWVTRVSQDGGATWVTTDEFNCSANRGTMPSSISTSPNGSIYIAGHCQDAGGTYSLGVIRKSADGGQTWSTITPFELSAGKNTMWRDVKAIGMQDVFVAGFGTSSDDTAYWVIRRSSDGGATWSTVEQSLLTGASGVNQELVIAGDATRVLVAAIAKIAGVDQLIVRQSLDNGATWGTVLSRTPDSNWSAPNPTALTIEANGIFLATYSYNTTAGDQRVVIEKSRDSTNWFQVYRDSASYVTDIAKCGTGICTVGQSDAAFKVGVWTFFKFE